VAIEPEFVCFDRLSTLNIVVSDLTNSQPLLQSAVLVATVWSSANLGPKQKGPDKSDPSHLHPFDDGNDDALRRQLLTS
tara:strand:- start:141 stop:377 length:237 start_codon:yes stop_codon:yes gene_type:complete